MKPWLIEKLRKDREQRSERPRLRIQPPMPDWRQEPPRPQRREEPESDRGVWIFQM